MSVGPINAGPHPFVLSGNGYCGQSLINGVGEAVTCGYGRGSLLHEVDPEPQPAEPLPALPTRRLRDCVENWPEAETGSYDPRCCRFPKSCSATVYDEGRVADEDLEPAAVPSVPQVSEVPQVWIDVLTAEAGRVDALGGPYNAAVAVGLTAAARMLRAGDTSPLDTVPQPVVLCLPEVPEGAVALIGNESRRRWLPYCGPESDRRLWQYRTTDAPWSLASILADEPTGVTVEFAPPREPRTWPRLEGAGDVLTLRGASGTVYTRRPTDGAWHGHRDGRTITRSLGALCLEDGPLTEVLGGVA